MLPIWFQLLAMGTGVTAMADKAIPDLPHNPGVASGDKIEVIDVSNTSNNANGENTYATVAEFTAGLSVMVGDSGSGGTKGLAPAPASGDAAAGKFLKADGTYAVPAGGGGGSPGGSSSQLQYNNAGAFGGASLITLGSGGELVLGSMTEPTISGTGQIWNDSGRFGIVVTKGGGRGPLSVPLWSGVNCTAVATTASLTSLLAGGTSRGSLTLDGTKLAIGQYLDFDMFGTWGCTGTPTLKWELLVNGVIIGQSAATPFSNTFTNKYWIVAAPIRLYILATGVSGSMICKGQIQTYADVHGYTFTSAGVASSDAPTAVTVDLSGSVPIDVKVQWGTSNSANTIQLLGGTIELRG